MKTQCQKPIKWPPKSQYFINKKKLTNSTRVSVPNSPPWMRRQCPPFIQKTVKPTTLNQIDNEWKPMDLTQSWNLVCLQTWSAISIKKSSSHKWDGEVASTLARHPPFPPWKLHHPMWRGQEYTREILEICVSFLWEIRLSYNKCDLRVLGANPMSWPRNKGRDTKQRELQSAWTPSNGWRHHGWCIGFNISRGEGSPYDNSLTPNHTTTC